MTFCVVRFWEDFILEVAYILILIMQVILIFMIMRHTHIEQSKGKCRSIA